MVMHARVVSAMLAPGQEEKLRRILDEVIVPAAQEQAGFCGALTLLDRGTGRGMMITLWASAEDLLASEASGYIARQIAAVAPVLRGAAVRETYEVEMAAGNGSSLAEIRPGHPAPAT